VVDPSGVRFVTIDVVHAVIFYLSDEYCTTLYVVYVWGDRCGREVPHFDSRPVSISDPRVGMTPLGLFGPEPDGNGPTTLACRPVAELTLVLLVWWLLATKTISLCPSKDLEMLIHEKRYEKCEITQLRNEGDPWKYIGFLLVQRNYFLATWTTYNDVCPAYQTEDRDLYKRLYKAFASIHI
jgi:hypothetical protein